MKPKRIKKTFRLLESRVATMQRLAKRKYLTYTEVIEEALRRMGRGK